MIVTAMVVTKRSSGSFWRHRASSGALGCGARQLIQVQTRIPGTAAGTEVSIELSRKIGFVWPNRGPEAYTGYPVALVLAVGGYFC